MLIALRIALATVDALSITVKAGNDDARAKELEKYGGESQELAEQQVFG